MTTELSNLTTYIIDMTRLWENELTSATRKGDAHNILYCKAKHETYHHLLMDIKAGRFNRVNINEVNHNDSTTK